MAEINKLSVSKVLDKLRSNDAKDNRSKLDRLDDEIKTVGEEVQRLRAQRNRLKRGRRASAIKSDGEL
jgi:SMC interacting uncharacterized protein involved in chromosome segregation